MKMSKPGVCCDNCFGKIASRSTGAARLWMDLCEIDLKNPKGFGIRLEDFPTLRLLEVLGFVVTTETDSMIIVHVQGKTSDSYGTYFCGGKCNDS